MQNKQSGFTLIEMLVVIAIIGILASVIVIGLSGAREQSRDAKRVADIRQLQNSLELQYQDPAGYPSPCSSNNGVPVSGNCPGPTDPQGSTYQYEVRSGGTAYSLGICLESADRANASGGSDASCPASLGSCSTGNAFCVAP